MSRIDSKGSPHTSVRAASWATVTVFALNGFVFASWLSRLPAIRDDLGLTPSTIGLLLLVGSLGSVIALPLAGTVVTRWGTARTVAGAALLASVGLLGVMIAFGASSVVAMAALLALTQAGIAAWDVAMNLEGTRVEQALHRAIMPAYHAAFSGGTVFGAGLGALMAHLGVPVAVHLLGAAALAVLLVAAAVRRFLPQPSAAPEGHGTADSGGTGGLGDDGEAANAHRAGAGARAALAAWLEPRTLLIGLMVLSAALTEGAANDWLTLASIDAFGLDNSQGALVLAVFLVAMTAMRLVGTRLLDAWGRVLVLRVCIAAALLGLLAFTLAPVPWLAIIGVVLWGIGAALGFPVGMSAASDEPAHAAARLSVVSTIGYTAFLAGPPLLGLLAEHVGLRHALLVIAVPLLISLLVTGAARPPRVTATADGATRGS
ncbi:MFS transporter [Serinibacter salmoneus]|uniref:Putative MFS family arabinose efflux permease n=1 Tax=Serinibacter salmoneus TaxID=556530 RepID=A0A2A9CWV3_9MICO|nr:MFS transporter [Serinibacter salmoneus]PFG18908.1 putative MFS family arabinose efflux permease [Serinibacter salmoneus]